MGRSIRFERPQFDAREAEEITGVSLVTQRDWRRRELLSNSTDDQGRAIYEPAEIVELMIINALVSMGVGVSVAKNVFGIARLPVESWIDPESIVAQSYDRRFVVIVGDEVFRSPTIEGAMRAANSYAAIVLDIKQMVETLRQKATRPLSRKIESED